MAKKKKEQLPEVPSDSQVNETLQKVEEAINTEQLPIVDAVGMFKIEGQGPYAWVALRFKIQGDKVISVESTEPNMRDIAREEAKMFFSKAFLMG